METFVIMILLAGLSIFGAHKTLLHRHKLWLQGQYHEWNGAVDGQHVQLIFNGNECVFTVNSTESFRVPIDVQVNRSMNGVLINCAVTARSEALSGAEIRIVSGATFFVNDQIITRTEKMDSNAVDKHNQMQHWDSRWQNAHTLLTQVRNSMQEEPSVLLATEQLSTQLQSLFSMLSEIDSPDVNSIWENSE